MVFKCFLERRIVIKGKKRKSNNVLRVILIILAVIVIILAVILVWQKDNISVVINASKYSNEDIQQQISDNKKSVESELEQYNVTGLRDFTQEEEEAIRKGELSVEEAVERIVSASNLNSATGEQANSVGDSNSGNAEANNSSNSGSSSTGSTATSNSSDIVSEYTVKLYSLKATYLGQIGNLIDQAKADYKSGISAKSIMSKYIGQAASLESEADSKVDALLNELKGKLNAIGADTSIINTMKSSYDSEKALKKSYYISLFTNK